jgi:hypothetical protein
VEGEERERDITGVYPQSLQDPKMGGSRLAKMADEEEELGTSGHEVEHPPMAGGAGEKGDDERVSSGVVDYCRTTLRSEP